VRTTLTLKEKTIDHFGRYEEKEKKRNKKYRRLIFLSYYPHWV